MRNIVLITLDSLRADHCSFMGYHRKTTPNLDKMVKKGIVFKNAIAPAPRTIPSMPQIFTGKLMNFIEVSKSKSKDVGWRKDTILHLQQNKTISEMLSSKGYSTAAFCSNAFTSRYFGFNKGFDYFQDFLFSRESHQKIFEKMIKGSKLFSYIRNIRNLILKQEAFKTWESYYEEIIEWVERAKEPFFLWVFLLDTHLPWIVPKKFRKWGNFFDMYYCGWKIFRLLKKENATISEKTKMKFINTYDDSICYTDYFVGNLQKNLESYDPIFVVHADHGEEFGERGFYGHYYPHLYEENIHVPWIIYNVDEKDVVEKPISLIRLPEITLNLAVNDSFSLDNIITRNEEIVLSKDFDYKSKRYVVAVRMKDWKFITGQKSEDELYNLKKDTNERENLVNEYPELAREMKRIVEKHMKLGMEKKRIQNIVSSLGYNYAQR